GRGCPQLRAKGRLRVRRCCGQGNGYRSGGGGTELCRRDTQEVVMTDAKTTPATESGSTGRHEAADERTAADRETEETRARENSAFEHEVAERQRRDERSRREQYGGLSIGADFFGWLVAVAMTVLLAAIIGAVAAALNDTVDISRTEAE